MAVLDGDIGNVIRCDRCGVIHDFDHSDWEIRQNVWWPLFKGRPRPMGDKNFCHECAAAVTPLMYRLRDIDELHLFANKLKKAINEKRSKNNRATANSPGQRCKGSLEWGLGDSEGGGDTQACEEHF